MPLATRIWAIGCQDAITIGVWKGDDWAIAIFALRAASAIWLAATTPDGKKKSGMAPGTTRAAISRLPMRVTDDRQALVGQDLANARVLEEGLDVERDHALELGRRSDGLGLGALRAGRRLAAQREKERCTEAGEHQQRQHDLGGLRHRSTRSLRRGL